MEIIEVSHGLANCVEKGNEKFIEVNENLKKYPKYYNKIIEHETKHFHSTGKIDIGIELKDMFSPYFMWESAKFTIRHPSALTQSFPVYKSTKGWAVDYFVSMVYGIAIISGLGVALL